MSRRFHPRAAAAAAAAVSTATTATPTEREAIGDTIVFGHVSFPTWNHVKTFQTDAASDTAISAETTRGRAANASGRPSSRNGTAGAKKRGPGETAQRVEVPGLEGSAAFGPTL